jgi:hypothetical protein
MMLGSCGDDHNVWSVPSPIPWTIAPAVVKLERSAIPVKILLKGCREGRGGSDYRMKARITGANGEQTQSVPST